MARVVHLTAWEAEAPRYGALSPVKFQVRTDGYSKFQFSQPAKEPPERTNFLLARELILDYLRDLSLGDE